MHSDVLKDGSRNSASFEMEFLGLATNGQQYFHVPVVTRPSLQAESKLDENGHGSKAVSDTISFF